MPRHKNANMFYLEFVIVSSYIQIKINLKNIIYYEVHSLPMH